MALLILYILIALGFSFLCSVAEAVILSVSRGYILVLERKGERSGAWLRQQTQDINRPLAAILTLNTIAHTMGAAGAGAQAAAVFGDAWMGVISAVLTLMILVFSEIIPKTIGATHWRKLAPAVAWFLHYLILLLHPFVLLSQKMTDRLADDGQLQGLTRGELAAMAELSRREGSLARMETEILQNMLGLHQLKVRDAMTHRTVVFSIPETMTVEAFFYRHHGVSFSRIPLYEGEDKEKLHGYVLKSDLMLAQARGNGSKPASEYRRPTLSVHSSLPLTEILGNFVSQRGHLVVVVDEYGGLEGILTMEDVMEALLGLEIVDERDRIVSMKKLALSLFQRRQKPSEDAGE
jgi:CBS domain containing-hemolysin-like protein